MSYRKTIQSNGLVTLHDVAIFAECERGGKKFDAQWMDRVAKNHQIEERNGIRSPIFVKHNGDVPKSEERAEGLLSNFRRAKVAVGSEQKEGLVTDLTDLSPEVADDIVSNRLCARSIETISPMSRFKIDGLALLGRTAPFHALRQGSEPIDKFSFDENLDLMVLENDADQFMGAPPMGGPPMNSNPTPGAGNPAALVQQIQQLCQQLGQMLGGGQPAAQAPAAPAQPAPQKYSNEELEAEKLKIEKERLEAEKFALEEAAKKAQLEAEDAKFSALFAELRAEGRSFTEAVVRERVTKFGLETFNREFRPLMLKAPVGGAPNNAMLAAGNSVPGSIATDADLQQFAAAAPEAREAAIRAAKEYDTELARNPSFGIDNPRARFIANDVKEFLKGA